MREAPRDPQIAARATAPRRRGHVSRIGTRTDTRPGGSGTLDLALPDGSTRSIDVRRVFNAGYAGRAQEEVAAATWTVPALHPVSPYLAAQTDRVPAQHDRTSGEDGWDW